MSDERTPDDARDERIAERLAVPPLDELTRRRLVTRALEAQGAPRRARPAPWMIGAAAAVVLLLVAGVVAVAIRSSGDGTTSAERTHDRSAAEDVERQEAAPSAGAVEDAGASPVDLGDLGAFSDLDALTARALEVWLTARVPAQQVLLDELAHGRCADEIAARSPEFGPALAIGTATFRGRRLLVWIGHADDGVTDVAATFTDTCEPASPSA